MTLPNDWPTLCAKARLEWLTPKCGQRAYRDEHGDVRFYPSRAMKSEGDWGVGTGVPESWHGHQRLTYTETARIWATRPQ